MIRQPKVDFCCKFKVNSKKLNSSFPLLFLACKLEISRHVLASRPPLFQHLGVYSSMKGKIQKLKEKAFNSKENLFFGHNDNPDCKLTTDLITYKTFDLESAYNGDNYFWSLSARKNNYIQFEFVNPIIVDQYRIRSGRLAFEISYFEEFE